MLKTNRKLECVTVCVNYTDFLEISIQENKKHFDNIIIVTSHDDLKTQKFCKDNNIECVITDRFYKNGAIFDKGSAINDGLLRLKYKSFVCHLDCDIVLPDNFREQLKLEDLDSNILYGCRRFFIDTYKEWLEFRAGSKIKDNFTGLQWGGWGCGFIQIWDMKSDKIKDVPIQNLYPSYPTAAESDILMLKRFHPDVREVGKLNMDVAHLGNSGVNHNMKDNKTFFEKKEKIKIGYFELFYSKWHEDYSINARKYGGGSIFAKWAKEKWNKNNPDFEFHIFAPKKCWEHIDEKLENKECFHELPESYGQYLLSGGHIKNIISNIDYLDVIMLGHDGSIINNSGCRPIQIHWSIMGRPSDSHPLMPYTLIYGNNLNPAYSNQKIYPVKIGKPIPPIFEYREKEDFIFVCSSHDNSKDTIPLAKECLKHGIKGIFAGIIQKNYPLLDFIDNKTTFFLGEISDSFKYELANKARLSAFLGTCPCVFSLGVIEMLAYGVPILRNNTNFNDWLEETIINDYNGYIYDGTNFLKCWNKSKNINQQNCWETAKKYSTDEMVNSFGGAIKTIVKNHKLNI